MIKNIIFDFGDIFINLDKEIIFREIVRYGGSAVLSPEILDINLKYETGSLTSTAFVSQLGAIYPKATAQEIISIWNGMLLDFPEERLAFIEAMARENTYRLFLLSNTNALHIEAVRAKMGATKFERFQNAFEGFYLSHEIQLRKPNAECFEYVLEQNSLKPEETFFIDDTKQNTDAAERLGIRCWNLQVGREDITQLKTRLK